MKKHASCLPRFFSFVTAALLLIAIVVPFFQILSLSFLSQGGFSLEPYYKVLLASPAYLLTWIPDSLIYPILMANVPVGAQRYKWLFLTVPVSLISALLGAQLVDWIYRPVAAFTKALGQKPFFSS